MSREEKSKQRHETHSSSSPAAIIIMVITAIITVLYIRLVHRAIEVIYSCLFLLGVFFFLHLYIETNKRKELADLQLLGISETQASPLLDGWAAARSALSNQLICAANSQQLEKCHHSRTGKGRLNVPARKQTFWTWHNCSLKRPSAQLRLAVGNSLLILSSPFGKRGEWAGFPSIPERQEVVDLRTEVIAGTAPLRLKPSVASWHLGSFKYWNSILFSPMPLKWSSCEHLQHRRSKGDTFNWTWFFIVTRRRFHI